MVDAVHAARAGLEARLLTYRPQVQRHIMALVRDPAEAEELTQDTYARALDRIDNLRDPQAALAWLYRIATNVCLDHLRRRRLPTIPLDSDGSGEDARAATQEDHSSLIETALERSEMSECVQSYLETLPDDYRAAIFLHDVCGLRNPEIARLLDCSVATAKIRLHRARRRLREVLDAACAFDIDERGVLVCEPTPSGPRANAAR